MPTFVVPSNPGVAFFVRVVSSWNSLHSAAVELSDLGAFKTALKDFLGQKLYDYYP